MKKIFLYDAADEKQWDAGNKARNDALAIAMDRGYNSYILFYRTHGRIKRLLELIRALHKVWVETEGEELILIQHPYNSSVMRILNWFFKRLRNKKSANPTVIILIHDLVFLRTTLSDKERKIEETFLNSADILISHNKYMTNVLKEGGIVHPEILNLDIFDYLYDGETTLINSDQTKKVVFAGNLSKEKSGFLYSVPALEGVQLELYGKVNDSLPSHHHYNGSFPPNDLIAHLSGDYGLIWDGPSHQTCTGEFGNYLRYNNPHKLSLYVAAGLPCIVWEESAMNEFVTEHGVGISVSSLEDIPEVLGNVSDEEYASLQKNVEKLSQLLQKGYYLNSVLDEAERRCK